MLSSLLLGAALALGQVPSTAPGSVPVGGIRAGLGPPMLPSTVEPGAYQPRYSAPVVQTQGGNRDMLGHAQFCIENSACPGFCPLKNEARNSGAKK
jgi:hypothetical protein